MNNFLAKAEMLLLALFAATIALEFFEIKLSILYTISLSGLSLVFLLNAQFPFKIEGPDEKKGFKYLLGLSILPRILWISTSVTTVGILFYIQELAGINNLLVIGGISIVVCTLILLVLRFMKIDGLEIVFQILYRSYPALLAAAYIVFK